MKPINHLILARMKHGLGTLAEHCEIEERYGSLRLRLYEQTSRSEDVLAALHQMGLTTLDLSYNNPSTALRYGLWVEILPTVYTTEELATVRYEQYEPPQDAAERRRRMVRTAERLRRCGLIPAIPTYRGQATWKNQPDLFELIRIQRVRERV